MTTSIATQLADAVISCVRSRGSEAVLASLTFLAPDRPEHGDYASNAALILARREKSSPMELATTLKNELEATAIVRRYVSRIEIAKPGFINFFLDTTALARELQDFLKSLTDITPRNEKIVIEHTNVNPNKAMHIGHLRNSVLGDTIARVLARAGYDTEVQYYVDDTGVQVADTYLGLRELKVMQQPGEKYDHYCWRVYADITQAYAQDTELLAKRNQVLHEIEKGDTSTAREVKELAGRIVRDHLKTMAAFQIGYDLLVWESDILAFGFWKAAFAKLKASPLFVEEREGKNAGCWVIKTGDETAHDDYSPDKVIVKSDGTVTYTGKDVAYHMWKFDLLGIDFNYEIFTDTEQEKPLTTTSLSGKSGKKFGHADFVYNVIDVRQSYPQAMVRLALLSLDFKKQAERIRHVSYGVVSLAPETARALGMGLEEGKKAYSMSGRKGIGIKVDDLLSRVEDEVKHRTYAVEKDRGSATIAPRDVAVGAIKYAMLRYHPQTDIVFDIENVLSLEGNTGPYIQYAHARMAGIVRKAGEAVSTMPETIAPFTPEEERLLKLLYQWPQIMERVTDELSVNGITTYAFDLANAFNSFYEAVPVLKAEDALQRQRLALVYACKTVLADAASVLGIQAPESM